ncbi:MAG: hypothetical protein PHT69_06075 [Bacteroidales bacterium]|nr:hypothetical protein [Bacteroidales bacterium]
MKKICILSLLLFIVAFSAKAQPIGLSFYGGPSYSFIKYKDFNTFAESYNGLNSSNLKLPGSGLGYMYGGDLLYEMFHFGFYFNKLTVSTDPVKLTDFSARQFDLRLNNYISNIGFTFGESPLSFSTFVVCGINSLDLDAYINYFGKYKSYGNYLLDGTFSGMNMLIGLGFKVNFTYAPLYASIGFSQAYSVLPTASISDLSKPNDNGYTEIGLDWSSFTSGNSWDYQGAYMSSSNRQSIIQFSLGLFLGE